MVSAHRSLATKRIISGITLTSPGGFHIELTPGFDPQTLQTVLRILELLALLPSPRNYRRLEKGRFNRPDHENLNRAIILTRRELNWPRDIVKLELSEEEKQCYCCGKDLKAFGHESSCKLDIVPAQVNG